MDPLADPAFSAPQPRLFKDHLASIGFTDLALLGKGASGVVFRAREVRLRRIVAVKWLFAPEALLPEDLDQARCLFSRFSAEAAILASLSHSNIVKVYSTGEFQGRPFIVMEFVGDPCVGKARTLKAIGTVPRQAALMVAAIAEGMATVHDRNIIHRDLKPDNILLRPDGNPVVVDFGLAHRVQPPGANNLTMGSLTRARAGTPDYMAPEQVLQDQRLTAATDQWALGVILYELITGQTPFRKANDDLEHEILSRIADPTFPIPRPRRLNHLVDPNLEAICLKALSRFPGDRYASVGELAADLRRYDDSGYSLAAEIQAGPITRVAVSAKLGVRRNRRTLAAFAVVATLLGMLASLYWLYFQRETNNLFEDWVYQWGIPSGLNEVSTSTLHNRFSTYRLVRRGIKGPVIRCEHIRGDGELVDDPNPERAAVLEIDYEGAPDGTARVQHIVFRDQHRQERFVKSYAYKQSKDTYTVTFKSGDKVGYLGRGLSSATSSSIVGYRVLLTEEGLERKYMFLGENSRRSRETSGAWGWGYEYAETHSARGRRILEYPLGDEPSSTSPITLTNGISIIETYLDSANRVSGQAIRGHVNQPIQILEPLPPLRLDFHRTDLTDSSMVASPRTEERHSLLKESIENQVSQGISVEAKGCQGFFVITNRYDRFGNLTSTSLYDTQGNPACTASGWHTKHYHYDAHFRTQTEYITSREGKVLKVNRR